MDMTALCVATPRMSARPVSSLAPLHGHGSQDGLVFFPRVQAEVVLALPDPRRLLRPFRQSTGEPFLLTPIGGHVHLAQRPVAGVPADRRFAEFLGPRWD